MSEQQKQPALTAAQRLEGLEAAVKTMDAALYNIVNEINRISSEQKILERKVNAVISMLESGHSVTSESVSKEVVSSKLEEMKASTAEKVKAGTLVPETSVSENSYVVGREIETSSGEVLNPRVQFAVFALTEESGIKEKVVGKNVGDAVEITEAASLVIEEVYSVNNEA